MITETNKLSFTMDIPYVRTEWKHIFSKEEFHEVKALKFESTVVGVVGIILSLISKLPTELIGSTKHHVANNLMIKHREDVIEIIALSIQNTRKRIDPELTDFINDNFTIEHLFEAMNYVMICLQLDKLIMGFMIFKPSILASFDSARAKEPEIRKITTC